MLQELIVNLQQEDNIIICICDHIATSLLQIVDTAMILSGLRRGLVVVLRCGALRRRGAGLGRRSRPRRRLRLRRRLRFRGRLRFRLGLGLLGRLALRV